MSERKDEKWLDEQLRRAVDGATPTFDAEAWKDKYAREFQTLLGRKGQPSRHGMGSVVRWVLRSHMRSSTLPGGSLNRSLGMARPVNGDLPGTEAQPSPRPSALRLPPILTHPLSGFIAKLAIAAAVVATAGILLVGRPEPGPRPPAVTVDPASPAQMVSMISLSAAFRRGGIDELDRQCERAMERLGPRPNGVSMQELLKDINGNGTGKANL